MSEATGAVMIDATHLKAHRRQPQRSRLQFLQTEPGTPSLAVLLRQLQCMQHLPPDGIELIIRRLKWPNL